MKKALPYVFLLIAFNSFAQISSYKNLLLPDVDLHRFTLSGNFDYRLDSANSDFDFPLSASLSGYKNHRYKQTFYSAGLYNGILRKRDGDFLRTNSTSILSLSINQTRYSKNYFFIRAQASVNYDLRFGTNNNEVGYRRTRTLRNNTNLSFGKGRLEPIDWAIRAGFMNKSLLKSGAINNDLSEEVLLELARTMAVQDRSRFFENRFYNIRRVRAIDSVISKNGIEINELEFYTTINDQYYFAPQRGMFTGSRIELTTNTQTEFKRDLAFIVADSFDRNLQSLVYNFGIRYEYHLPQNLYLHHAFYFGFNFGNGQYQRRAYSPDFITNIHDFDNRFNISARYQFNWFPSTRTAFNFSTSAYYSFIDNGISFNQSTNISLNYFVNRRLSYGLNANLLYEYNKLGPGVSSGMRVRCNGSLIYQLW